MGSQPDSSGLYPATILWPIEANVTDLTALEKYNVDWAFQGIATRTCWEQRVCDHWDSVLSRTHCSRGYLNVSDCNQSAISPNSSWKDHFSMRSPNLSFPSIFLPFFSPSFLYAYLMTPPPAFSLSPLPFVHESNCVCPSAAKFILKETRLQFKRATTLTLALVLLRNAFHTA